MHIDFLDDRDPVLRVRQVLDNVHGTVEAVNGQVRILLIHSLALLNHNHYQVGEDVRHILDQLLNPLEVTQHEEDYACHFEVFNCCILVIHHSRNYVYHRLRGSLVKYSREKLFLILRHREEELMHTSDLVHVLSGGRLQYVCLEHGE